MGESSGVVSGEEKLCWLNERSESSGDCKDEVEDDDAEWRSGALYASMFVVDNSSTGPEILPLLIVPDENFTWPSRYGIGEETSMRFERLVNALVSVDMLVE